MKTITKPVYYCDYCKKKGLSKFAMGVHEEMCFHNPQNRRPCFNCNHLEKKEVTIMRDGYYQEYEETKTLFHCQLKDTFMYTPQNELKGNRISLESIDKQNEPMPMYCDQFNDELPF